MVAAQPIVNPPSLDLEAVLQDLPEHHEWVDGKFVEKNSMTLKHSRVQLKLGVAWSQYKDVHHHGGEVYTEAPCRTRQQIRRPDVAYLTPDLLNQLGEPSVLPQSFPLIAEIISPTDFAEDVFGKANEYLASSCQEVWLVLPESRWVAVLTAQQHLIFTQGETVSTQLVLPGFSVTVQDLLS
jgi:Uma2 family endonuclease